MPAGGAYVLTAGAWKRRGRTDVPALTSVFALGQSRPVPGDNVGHSASLGALTAYSGTGAGVLLTINAPATFNNVDFGSTQVDVRSSDVHFNNCLGTWTKTHDLTTTTVSSTSAAGSMQGFFNLRNGTSFSNRTFTRCTFINASQWSPTTVPVIGYGYTLDRCTIKHFGDGFQAIAPSGNPVADVTATGCFVGDLSWWWAPTAGIVHPSTLYQHCDSFQWQGGTGIRIEGCDMRGLYSTTIGTGTPNSGNDTAGLRASTAPSTQAVGVQKRFEVVEGSGTFSAGTVGAFEGGSLSCLMFSTSPRGYVPQADIVNNWLSGGAYCINAGDNQLVNGTRNPTMVITGNRVDRNQRHPGYAFGLEAALTATVSNNRWTDDGSLIARKNA